jgi:Uma2 family endonuclease
MSRYTITTVSPTPVEQAYIPRVPPRRKAGTYRMSYEEFRAWSDEDTHAEWVEGVVTVFMPPIIRHQAFAGFLHALITHFARLFGLGEIFFAPFEVCIRPKQSYREPDLFFVVRERLHLLTQERMEEPPDLIIEIVSKGSVKRDYVEKHNEYQRSGVREYWIIRIALPGLLYKWK